MKFIGITGGVGAGKSEVLLYLQKVPTAVLLFADDIAHQLMEPGTDVYQKILNEFSQDHLCAAGEPFDKEVLSSVIFSDEKKRKRLDDIVHPAVKAYILSKEAALREEGTCALLVLEAALLIEEEYGQICDELWYVYADEPTRKLRLAQTRGYSEQKADRIMKSQKSEEDFRLCCDVVIKNGGSLTDTFSQIDLQLRRLFSSDAQKNG